MDLEHPENSVAGVEVTHGDGTPVLAKPKRKKRDEEDRIAFLVNSTKNLSAEGRLDLVNRIRGQVEAEIRTKAEEAMKQNEDMQKLLAKLNGQ